MELVTSSTKLLVGKYGENRVLSTMPFYGELKMKQCAHSKRAWTLIRELALKTSVTLENGSLSLEVQREKEDQNAD